MIERLVWKDLYRPAGKRAGFGLYCRVSGLLEQVVQTVFDSMSDALVSGDRIELRGFGSFCVKEYDGHTGRNPKSGDAVDIKPKKIPRFRVGKPFSERIMGQAANVK